MSDERPVRGRPRARYALQMRHAIKEGMPLEDAVRHYEAKARRRFMGSGMMIDRCALEEVRIYARHLREMAKEERIAALEHENKRLAAALSNYGKSYT